MADSVPASYRQPSGDATGLQRVRNPVERSIVLMVVAPGRDVRCPVTGVTLGTKNMLIERDGAVPVGHLKPEFRIKQDLLRSRKLWLTTEVDHVIFHLRHTKDFTKFTGDLRTLTDH